MDKNKCVFTQLLERVERRMEKIKITEFNPQTKEMLEELERNKQFLLKMIKVKNERST